MEGNFSCSGRKTGLMASSTELADAEADATREAQALSVQALLMKDQQSRVSVKRARKNWCQVM